SVFVIGHIIIDIKEITLIWLFFFFKQKTAYEITRRDWSSDVCSSDLVRRGRRGCACGRRRRKEPAPSVAPASASHFSPHGRPRTTWHDETADPALRAASDSA